MENATSQVKEWQVTAAYLLKQLPANVNDARVRALLDAAFSRELRSLRERQRAGSAGPQERRFLELLDASP